MAGVGVVGTYTIDSAKKTLAIFPTDKNEQQRIAEFFTALDEQISVQGEALAALKVHKKGLMQGLFPSGAGRGRTAGG